MTTKTKKTPPKTSKKTQTPVKDPAREARLVWPEAASKDDRKGFRRFLRSRDVRVSDMPAGTEIAVKTSKDGRLSVTINGTEYAYGGEA